MPITQSRPLLYKTTLGQLWQDCAGKRPSGRLECLVTVYSNEYTNRKATHIYRGYNAIRLEAITGSYCGKGFQGDTILHGTESTPVTLLVNADQFSRR